MSTINVKNRHMDPLFFLRHRGLLAALAGALSLAAIPATAADWIYTVVDGDNLWDVSTRYLDTTLRYEQLRRLNNIERPRRMQPGTRIRVPMKWIRSNPAQAVVMAIGGRPTLMRHDGSQEDLDAAGATIGLGDRLRTPADSSVAVRFADGSVVTLYENSEMLFDHLSAHGETGMVDSRLRLIEGRLDTRVKPAVGPGSRFEIHTPSAISAVRGTTYRAATRESGRLSNIEVIEGRVAVAGASKSLLVRGGFGTQVRKDAAPQRPSRLLPAPQIEPYPQPIRYLNEALRWQPVDGASAYRVEIGAGTTLDVLAWGSVVQGPRVRLPDLADGEYRVRVRAIDKNGLEGRDRVIGMRFDTHPRPPVPLRPIDNGVLRGRPADLSWTASADAERYRLEIAADEGFLHDVTRLDDLDATTHVAAAFVAPGTYYWRVSSVAADGEVGPPSEIRRYQIKPVPEAVATALSESDGALVASWRPAGPAAQYQVQLANDPGFSDLQIDKVIAESQLRFEPTSGQVRYLRVRVVEDDGYLGPWGAVQRVDPPPDPTAWFVPILGVLGLLLL